MNQNLYIVVYSLLSMNQKMIYPEGRKLVLKAPDCYYTIIPKKKMEEVGLREGDLVLHIARKDSVAVCRTEFENENTYKISTHRRMTIPPAAREWFSNFEAVKEALKNGVPVYVQFWIEETGEVKELRYKIAMQ